MVLDSNGDTITIGDKVKTPDGRVIKVRGYTTAEKLYRPQDCTIVDKDTPNSVSGGQGGNENDTVIWGN